MLVWPMNGLPSTILFCMSVNFGLSQLHICHHCVDSMGCVEPLMQKVHSLFSGQETACNCVCLSWLPWQMLGLQSVLLYCVPQSSLLL